MLEVGDPLDRLPVAELDPVARVKREAPPADRALETQLDVDDVAPRGPVLDGSVEVRDQGEERTRELAAAGQISSRTNPGRR